MRLLEEQRCDKLIIIISPTFFKDNMMQFITRYAQVLQICKKMKKILYFEAYRTLPGDNRKIIPCARENCGVNISALRGYAVLTSSRESPLFNFWKRLKETLDVGRISKASTLVPVISSRIDSISRDQKSAKKIKTAKQKPIKDPVTN